MSLFESTLLNLCKPLRNWTFQRFARAAHKKRRNGTNKNLTLARTRTQVLGISSADALPTKLRVPVGGTESCPYKLSNLKFTPLPSLHVDFYSRHDVNSFILSS